MKNKVILAVISLMGSNLVFAMKLESNKIDEYRLGQEFTRLISNNDIEKVQELIKAGANVNAKNPTGLTAIISAAFHGNKKIAELLINAGADVNIIDSNTQTALMYALMRDHKEVFKLLLQAGADLNHKDKFHRTVLSIADTWNNKETIELLNKTVTSWKQQVYKSIASNDKESFKKYILKVGTVCFKDKDGNNLLYYAMKAGNLELSKLIFSLKPELIAQVNKNGETPLTYIGANGEFIKLFRELLFN